MPTQETSAAVPGTASVKAQISLIPLAIAITAAVVVTVTVIAAAGFWMYTSGHLPGAAGGSVAAAKPVAESKPVQVQVVLDPLLVNLADSDGRSYLRVAVTLIVEQKPPAKGAKAKEEKPEKSKPVNVFEASERDALLNVLGRQTGEALLEPDGKERLKQQIRATLKQRVPEVVVDDVLFTDFLVQR